MNMLNIFIIGSVGLFVLILIICVLLELKHSPHKLNTSLSEQKKNNFNIIGDSKWRGGVRYPLGLYKTEEEFYKIEKQVYYPE